MKNDIPLIFAGGLFIVVYLVLWFFDGLDNLCNRQTHDQNAGFYGHEERVTKDDDRR